MNQYNVSPTVMGQTPFEGLVMVKTHVVPTGPMQFEVESDPM